MNLPVSVVIATRNRAGPLARTLAGLAEQSAQLQELVIVDASEDHATRTLCATPPAGLAGEMRYFGAIVPGAASQRNEGVAHARQRFILFLDDDILLEPNCIARLWAATENDGRLGGVNATITNQQFHPPGRATRVLYRLLDPRRLAVADYAGRVLGPGVNLLSADSANLPEIVPVEWLNTTCTLYRREALPIPPFPAFFTGYSFGEDLALSLRVAHQGWKLANARTARIFHDSQPGDHKANVESLNQMTLVNRHYIMTEVLGQRRPKDYLKLALMECHALAACLSNARSRSSFPRAIGGKLRGAKEIIMGGRRILSHRGGVV